MEMIIVTSQGTSVEDALNRHKVDVTKKLKVIKDTRPTMRVISHSTSNLVTLDTFNHFAISPQASYHLFSTLLIC